MSGFRSFIDPFLDGQPGQDFTNAVDMTDGSLYEPMDLLVKRFLAGNMVPGFQAVYDESVDGDDITDVNRVVDSMDLDDDLTQIDEIKRVNRIATDYLSKAQAKTEAQPKVEPKPDESKDVVRDTVNS